MARRLTNSEHGIAYEQFDMSGSGHWMTVELGFSRIAVSFQVISHRHEGLIVLSLSQAREVAAKILGWCVAAEAAEGGK